MGESYLVRLWSDGSPQVPRPETGADQPKGYAHGHLFNRNQDDLPHSLRLAEWADSC